MNYQTILDAAFDPFLASQLIEQSPNQEEILAALAEAGMTEDVFGQVVEIRKSMIRDGDGDGFIYDGTDQEVAVGDRTNGRTFSIVSSDLNDIKSLYKEIEDVFPEGKRQEQALNAINSGKWFDTLVFRGGDGKLQAVASVWKDPDEPGSSDLEGMPNGSYLRIGSMATSAPGIGRRVFDSIVDHAKSKGTGIYLSSLESSQGFYDKIGMKRGVGSTYYLTSEDVASYGKSNMRSKVREMYGLPPKQLSDWAKDKFGDNAQNFLDWFGDSKLVNKGGIPVEMYHGTNWEFSEFDPNTQGRTDDGYLGSGFYFAPDEEWASGYGERIVKAYLSIEKPFVVPWSSNLGHDSIIEARNAIAKIHGFEGVSANTEIPDGYELRQRDLEDGSWGYRPGGNNVRWGVYPKEHLYGTDKEIYGPDTVSPLSAIVAFNDELEGKGYGNASDTASLFKRVGRKKLSKALQENGYDGVITFDPDTKELSEVVVFNPAKIKSIDNAGTFSKRSKDIYKAGPAQLELFGEEIKDGDGDGMVDDGKPTERPVSKKPHEMSKKEFKEYVDSIKPLPRDEFRIGDIRVIRNPDSDDYASIKEEARSRGERPQPGEPTARFTNDNFGNKYIWLASQATHSMIEDKIAEHVGADLDQNNDLPRHQTKVRDAMRDGIEIPKHVKDEYPNYEDLFLLAWADKKFGGGAKNFIEWFGDSKVVNENGYPLVVYHGSEEVGFNEFKISNKPGEPGIWFTDNHRNADGYHSAGPGGLAGAGSGTYAVYLSMKKPLEVNWEEYAKKQGSPWGNKYNPSAMARLFSEAKSKGHDGLIIHGISDSGYFGRGEALSTNYVVFKPEQVKSATANRTFNSKNTDIRKSVVRDGDGDGLVDDGKPTERPASKESKSDELDTRLSFEHQKALGEYIGGNIGDSVRPKRVEEITGGIDASQMITGDDQNMIMLYAGVLGDDDVGKAVYGDSYDPKHPDRSQADKKLATFLIKLNGALNTVSSEAKYREAMEKVKGAKVVSFKNSSGGKLILHPAVRPDRESEWQLSTVGPDGTPYGHNNPPTFEEGVARALNASKDHYWNERGYSLDEIHKSMAAIGLADIVDRDSDGTIYDGTPWERSAPVRANEYKSLGVRSKAFKDWFGDWENGQGSKVLDLDGAPSENVEIDGMSDVPKVMYHGTAKGGFEEFSLRYNDKSEGLLYGPGFYFTDDQEIAGEYMNKDSYPWHEMNQSEMEAYLSDIEIMLPDSFEVVRYPRSGEYGAYAFAASKDDPSLRFMVIRELNDNPGKWVVERGRLHSSFKENAPQAYELMRSFLPTAEIKTVYLNIRNPLNIEGEVRTNDIVEEIDSIIKSGDFSGYPGYAASTPEVKAFIEPKLKDRLTKIRDNVVKWSNGEFIPGKGLYNELSGHGKGVAFWLLKECGFDGITHIGGQVMGNKSHRVWIAFYPNQIKAVDNVGTFDPSTGNIYKGSFWRRVVDGYRQAFGQPNQGKPVTDPAKPKTTSRPAASSGGPAKQQPAPVAGAGSEKDGDGDGLVNDGTPQERPVSQSAAVPVQGQQGQAQQSPKGGASQSAGGWEPEDNGPVVAEVKDQAAWKSLRDGNRNKFKEMIGGSNLSPERKKEYLGHMQTALNAMPIGAQQLVAENIKSTKWYENAQDLSASSAKILGIQLNEGEVIQGLYVSGSGTSPVGGEMHLDSGRDVVGTYLHEMAHGFDWDKQSGDRISSGQDWNKAWETEIVAGKLSAYGKTAAIEGFAEFARLVYANGETGRQIARKHFPQCTAIFERNGLL